MRALSRYIRATIAVLATVALVIAGPIHASHDHVGDPSQMDGPCVICKVLTAGSAWTAPVALSPQLQPVGMLAAEARAIVFSTPASIVAPRAPPVSFA